MIETGDDIRMRHLVEMCNGTYAEGAKLVASTGGRQARKNGRARYMARLKSLRKWLEREFPLLDKDGNPLGQTSGAYCPRCNTPFKRWKDLARHVNLLHAPKSETVLSGWMYFCWCGRHFKGTVGLGQHLRLQKDLSRHAKMAVVEHALKNM